MSTKKAMGTSKNGRGSNSKFTSCLKGSFAFVYPCDIIRWSIKSVSGNRYSNNSIGQGVLVSGNTSIISSSQGISLIKRSYLNRNKFFFVI